MVFLSSRPLLETLLYRFEYVAVLRAIFAFQTVFSWTLGFYNNSERTEYCYFRQMVGLSIYLSDMGQLHSNCNSVVINIAIIHYGQRKLHPFYYLNNFVKSRSVSIIFGAQIPE